MGVVRTPEDRFEDLAGFPWEPSYVEVGDLRMAYVDAGDPDAEETTLCLHGEPTWAYLYRKMIPRFSEAGRVIVPDLPGFGRSDKYDAVEDYTVAGRIPP
ncbi:hypothetical protein BRD00_05070 [Halobacteriales archaeon QS_8_69_26]|nr:MAG: hypothetical protein BRD00_05070 [Halobacteriales archaeon QS_8_69_26]